MQAVRTGEVKQRWEGFAKQVGFKPTLTWPGIRLFSCRRFMKANRSNDCAGAKMPSVLHKDSFRWLLPRMSERRLVCKNGECNISRVNIDRRGRRFLADIFTTMVDIKWRWNLLLFTMAFTVSWVIFALAWWLVAFSHRDLENYQQPGWKPCVEHVGANAVSDLAVHHLNGLRKAISVRYSVCPKNKF